MGVKERANLMVELEAAGQRRQAGVKQTEEALEEIGQLAARAVEEGMAKAEIARLAGVSRPTLDGLLAGERS